MKKAIMAAAAAFTITAGTVLGPASPAYATTLHLGETFPDNCGWSAPIGPNGWQHIRVQCVAPMQANDKMFRAKVILCNLDCFDTDTRVGEWRDCNAAVSDTEPAWLPANWEEAFVFVDYVNDTKPGGC